MKREDKYRDSAYFHFWNQNPRKKYTSDCVVRAISLAAGTEYGQTLIDLAKLQCDTGYALNDSKLYGSYLEAHGWTKHKQPRLGNGMKYTGDMFCAWLNMNVKGSENVIAHIGGGHVVAIVPHGGKYKVHDTWDSTQGCIGNYWTKERD